MTFLLHLVAGSLSPFTVFRHLEAPPPNRSHAQANQVLCVAELYGYATNGFHVDLTSNHATVISNTYVLDRLLEWRGVCIGPQAMYLAGYLAHRSCALVSSVVSANATVDFVESGGLGGIVGYDNKSGSKHVRTSRVADLGAILARTRPS